jgi:Spy/CpxP family protein refolding chaperone
MKGQKKEVRSMKKAGIAIGLAVVMLLSLSYVYAQQDPGAGRELKGVQGHKYEHLGKRLDLDQKQKASLHELHRKFKGETAQLIGELVTKRIELRVLWSDPKADSEAILAKEKELRDLQNQMKDKIVQYKLEARKLLKPEQIEKLGSMGGMGFGFGRGFHHHEMGFKDSF